MPIVSVWRNKSVLLLLSLLPFLAAEAHIEYDTVSLVRLNKQHAFPKNIPPGNYSGITYLGNNRYAVVSDKSEEDGFFVFSIAIDSVSGVITDVKSLGFKSSNQPNRDGEGIAYVPEWGEIFISGETNNDILAYGLDGHLTSRSVQVPAAYHHIRHNLGLEALSYSAQTHRLWTCNEAPLQGDGVPASPTFHGRNVLRMQSFSDSLLPMEQYFYRMDAPTVHRKARFYAIGVGDIIALSDGSLLVLEREFYVPRAKIGGFVRQKLYQTFPDKAAESTQKAATEAIACMAKQLVCAWKTTFGLLNRSFANYEGMCLGPRLSDGSQVIVLVSDSQNQYGGLLKDWFKTIIVKP